MHWKILWCLFKIYDQKLVFLQRMGNFFSCRAQGKLVTGLGLPLVGRGDFMVWARNCLQCRKCLDPAMTSLYKLMCIRFVFTLPQASILQIQHPYLLTLAPKKSSFSSIFELLLLGLSIHLTYIGRSLNCSKSWRMRTIRSAPGDETYKIQQPFMNSNILRKI
jgi:hypothetical protein